MVLSFGMHFVIVTFYEHEYVRVFWLQHFLGFSQKNHRNPIRQFLSPLCTNFGKLWGTLSKH